MLSTCHELVDGHSGGISGRSNTRRFLLLTIFCSLVLGSFPLNVRSCLCTRVLSGIPASLSGLSRCYGHRAGFCGGQGMKMVSVNVDSDAKTRNTKGSILKRKESSVTPNDNMEKVLNQIENEISKIETTRRKGNNDQFNAYQSQSEEIDRKIDQFLYRAFSPPFTESHCRQRVLLGIKALYLQLSSNLAPPYNTIPKKTYMKALSALSALNEKGSLANPRGSWSSMDAAFRILQRVVSGKGVRFKGNKSWNAKLQEKDFNMVLNGFSNSGRMEMAHRVIALQQRTRGAPPLSPVTYSILLKGYGRLADAENVAKLVKQAELNAVYPDVIMLNSLIDAYINCDDLESALQLFEFMKMPQKARFSLSTWVAPNECPRPNRRTYNTILKGLANMGELSESLKLCQEMGNKGLWDAVTTNTITHAAILSRNFSLAEDILAEYTTKIAPEEKYHPNVVAYTELLDGYAKEGELAKSLKVLKVMRNRRVHPNEVTYTCLIGGLARKKKVKQAQKVLRFMESSGMTPGAITYNSFISGLVAPPDQEANVQSDVISTSPTEEHVDLALDILYKMTARGVQPNEVTISVLILALGKCNPPRTQDANDLLSNLEKEGMPCTHNTRIATALIQAYGAEGNLKGAMDVLQQVRNPDSIAVNAFLDVCARCNQENMASKSFTYYFGNNGVSSGSLEPDVISYSIVIALLLRKNTVEKSKEAAQFFSEMRNVRLVKPDIAMVDLILKVFVRRGEIQRRDVKLLAELLEEAKNLGWKEGQFEIRKRAIQNVMSGRMKAMWQEVGELGVESEDELFRKKGWNKVDSGFRLWGGSNDWDDSREPEKVVDQFLASKGWNDVDSSFRIF